MTNRIGGVTGAALAALLVGAGLAAAGEKGDGPRRGKDGERWAAWLDLSADQQAKLKELRRSHHEAMRPKREAQAARRKELQALVERNASDADLKAKLDELKRGRDAIQAAQAAHQEAMAKLLTPKQQAKLVLGMAKRWEEGARRWNKGSREKDGDRDKDDDKDRDEDDD